MRVRAVDSTHDWLAGSLSTPDYEAVLLGALGMLDTFDAQLAAKTNNGQLTDPLATDLADASAQVRAAIQALIDGL